jgi:methionyl-tRNA formyltransferase
METSNGLRVSLFINHDIGLNVFKYLLQDNMTKIIQVYLADRNGDSNSEILKLCNLHKIDTYIGREVIEDLNHISIVKEKKIDFVISVYWPWLINDLYLDACKDSINFHPALLPQNRGWYPHVHNILNGSTPGVTLHRMSSIADSGDIWGQATTQLTDTDTSKDLYERLKIDIYNLFSEIWPKIATGLIAPFQQDERKASYNKKNALVEIDRIDLDRITSFKNMINLLRARTFGQKPFAYFVSDGKKIFVSITLYNEEEMSDDI